METTTRFKVIYFTRPLLRRWVKQIPTTTVVDVGINKQKGSLVICPIGYTQSAVDDYIEDVGRAILTFPDPNAVYEIYKEDTLIWRNPIMCSLQRVLKAEKIVYLPNESQLSITDSIGEFRINFNASVREAFMPLVLQLESAQWAFGEALESVTVW